MLACLKRCFTCSLREAGSATEVESWNAELKHHDVSNPLHDSQCVPLGKHPSWNCSLQKDFIPGLLMVRHVVGELQADLTSSILPEIVALSVASYLRDICGMQVKLCTDVHEGRNTPVGWLQGILIATDISVAKPPAIFVDCGFQTKFTVARPTFKYATFLQSQVPTIFVGMLDELTHKLEEVTTALQQCLDESGLELPPWRTLEFLKAFYRSCLEGEIATHSTFLLDCIQQGLDYSSKGATSVGSLGISLTESSMIHSAISVCSQLRQNRMLSTHCEMAHGKRLLPLSSAESFAEETYEFEKVSNVFPADNLMEDQPSGISMMISRSQHRETKKSVSRGHAWQISTNCVFQQFFVNCQPVVSYK